MGGFALVVGAFSLSQNTARFRKRDQCILRDFCVLEGFSIRKACSFQCFIVCGEARIYCDSVSDLNFRRGGSQVEHNQRFVI
jgi:hypothetical protein